MVYLAHAFQLKERACQTKFWDWFEEIQQHDWRRIFCRLVTSQYCLHHFEVDDGRTLYNFCTLLFDSDARKLEGLFTKKRSISVEESSVIRVDDVIILFKATYFHYVFEIFVAIFLMIINIEVTHNDNFFLFINYLFHVFVEKDIILFW